MTSRSSNRIEVVKTWKLYVGGSFPRSESGRSTEVCDDSGRIVGHVCRASRKDLRDAVETARGAAEGWARRSAYNRGQILYRMAEMAEGRRDELSRSIVECMGATTAEARRETPCAER